MAGNFDPTRPGFRLPTEVEWECGCRSGTVTRFSYGSDPRLLNQYARSLDNPYSVKQAGIVAQLRPNLRGLFDMHGSALEWCNDFYNKYYSASAITVGPAQESQRVLRGGGWFSVSDSCRSASRAYSNPDSRNNGLGFRLCVTLRDNKQP